MTAAFVAVFVGDHLDRDAWVDDQARAFPVDLGVPIRSNTYMGVWRIPGGEIVHLFALPEDVIAILRSGARYVRA